MEADKKMSLALNRANDPLHTIQQLKEHGSSNDPRFCVHHCGQTLGWLAPVTRGDADSPDAVALLADWRQAAADAFPSQFPVTTDGTRRWLIRQVVDVPDRLLFWVCDPGNRRIGHVGLYRFDFDDRSVELDNIVRGVKGVMPGIMYHGISTLMRWTFESLERETLCLRVFSDNTRALALYARLGFRETMRTPLARTQSGDTIQWIEVNGAYRRPVTRYFVTMSLPRDQWRVAAAA